MNAKFREFVTEKVEGGIKATALVADIQVAMCEGRLPNVSGFDILCFIDQLVSEGEIVEVEYILPSMNFRIKSLYLPKGAEVRVNSSGRAILCKHANECPAVCTCDASCYCKVNTCRPR